MFTPEDAEKHKSGMHEKKKKQWVRVAESVKKRMMKKGMDENSDAKIFDVTRQSVWRLMKRNLKAAGIKDHYNFSLHNIRKTSGMWLKTLIPFSREITEGEIWLILEHARIFSAKIGISFLGKFFFVWIKVSMGSVFVLFKIIFLLEKIIHPVDKTKNKTPKNNTTKTDVYKKFSILSLDVIVLILSLFFRKVFFY